MMRILDLIHRWGGGLLGLILAVLGLSGAILVHKELLVALPHANEAPLRSTEEVGRLTAGLLDGAQGGESLVLASEQFGLVQLRKPGGGGLYADQRGEIVDRWNSQWERPEIWLFDLHHHLFADDTGEIVAGIAGLAGVVFVLSGTILWWRTRRTFRLRAWPARLSRPAILMHHRDLGIVAAPVLLLVCLTGSMIIFRPMATFILSPLSPRATIEADIKPPRLNSGPLSPAPDWQGMVRTAHAVFPDAQIRIVSLPRKPGDPIVVRMKRPAEWLPNGRTTVSFDAATGTMLHKRDAMAMARGSRVFNTLYPLHAAKVGGLPYRLVMTLAGLALGLLGTLATWTFWFKRPRRRNTGTLAAAPANA
ncbi:MAG: PepSY-associated TM helix domain-containing protein [Novosphingobium sp.]